MNLFKSAIFMRQPVVEQIGQFLAVRFEDGVEGVFDGPTLRDQSPSAERRGEADLFGAVQGGETGKDYSQVIFFYWQWVGSYALRIFFSDGHSSGLFSYAYLYELAKRQRSH